MTNETKQTAVEWYTHKAIELKIQLADDEITLSQYVEATTKAQNEQEAMEKQQIMDAYKQGQYDGDTMRPTDAEQYYELIYKGITYGGGKQ